MPCRSDCPSGDCAGCDFPPPRAPGRCVPSACAQRDGCARAAAAPRGNSHDFDASGCKTAAGWCPLFIDTRGLALTTTP